MLDVLSHFHIQYAILLIVSALVLFSMADWRRRGLFLLPALLINLYLVAPFFMADTPTTIAAGHDVATPLRILSMNISTATAGYPQVVELIRAREPDIVFMSEVRADLVALLQSELGDQFPVFHAEPSRMTLGVAILARDPSVQVQTLSAEANIGRMQRRYLRADFVWDGTPVTLVGIHPLPPILREWALGRNREIALMGTLAQAAGHPFILVGDLNASPWSLAMRRLIADTDLRYAANGYGIRPTWLLGRGFVGSLLGSPLDHILVSPEWKVVGYTEAGDISSDHVPLQADLLLQ